MSGNLFVKYREGRETLCKSPGMKSVKSNKTAIRGWKLIKTMLIPIICFILERNYHKDLLFFVAGVGSGDLSATASLAATFESNLPLPREGQLCKRKLNRHSDVTNVCLSISLRSQSKHSRCEWKHKVSSQLTHFPLFWLCWCLFICHLMNLFVSLDRWIKFNFKSVICVQHDAQHAPEFFRLDASTKLFNSHVY